MLRFDKVMDHGHKLCTFFSWYELTLDSATE
jgi:hypothetical protein